MFKHHAPQVLDELLELVRLVCQDESCIAIVENPGQHRGRTKQWEAKIRWIEKAAKGEKPSLALQYVPTELMVADVLTKALAYEAFARHATYLKGVVFPQAAVRKRKRQRGQEED